MLLITCDQVETVAKFLQSISGHLVSKRRDDNGINEKIIIMAMGSTRGHLNFISLVEFNFFDDGINKGPPQLCHFIFKFKVEFFKIGLA